jgi:predicted dehydrogenase
MKRYRVGIIGCGKISAAYFKGCREFPILDVVACADLLPERARAQAEEFAIPRALTPEELLADTAVELVVNLTIPAAHHAVARAAIAAGKHVWSEKPLAVERAEGEELVSAAAAAGVLLGCAPDTFLGGGHQTCRKLLDDGWIGTPLHAVAFMAGPGHESWHPNPAFYYQPGGGPMFDMGPYYLTALVQLLGPVRSVTGLTRITHPERLITSEPRRGERITVEVPTHVQGLLQFASGAQAAIITSFDVQAHHLPRLEIYGSEGSLAVPDPNGPGGPVALGRVREEWEPVPLSHGYTATSRGIGVADMAYALRTGRPQRAGGELALHVLDIMHAIHEAAATGRHVDLITTCERPAPLPLGLLHGELD